MQSNNIYFSTNEEDLRMIMIYDEYVVNYNCKTFEKKKKFPEQLMKEINKMYDINSTVIIDKKKRIYQDLNLADIISESAKEVIEEKFNIYKT